MSGELSALGLSTYHKGIGDPTVFLFMDDFTRANTVAPSLGISTSTSTIPAFTAPWVSVNGDGSTGHIVSNAYTNDTLGGNCYWTKTQTGLIIRTVEMEVQWKGAYGGFPSGGGAATIILSPNTGGWTDKAIHLQINPIYMEMDKITTGLTITQLGQVVWNNQPIPIGERLKVNLQVSDYGDFLVTSTSATIGTQTMSGKDPYLGTCLGPSILLQAAAGGSATHFTEIKSVKIGTKSL